MPRSISDLLGNLTSPMGVQQSTPKNEIHNQVGLIQKSEKKSNFKMIKNFFRNYRAIISRYYILLEFAMIICLKMY